MGSGGYLQAVNGTPYRWKKTDGHTYQMLEAKFPDYIDPFTTYSIYVEFSKPFFGAWFDDEAWAQYTMEGVPSPTFFRLWANSKDGHMRFVLRLTGMTTLTGDGPNNNADIDLDFRLNPAKQPEFNGTTCIIAGVHGAFVTSSPHPLSKGNSWMAHSLATIGDFTLREICMPGSHNAGISVSRYSTAFGYEKAVICQFRPVSEQLAYGVRYFDIRPVIRGKDFETGHYGHSNLGWQGGSGQTIHEIVDQINVFTRNNHEVVILSVSHAYNIDEGYREFNKTEWDTLFSKEFDRLERFYETTSPGVDLSKLKIKELIKDGKQAAVIIRFDYGKTNGNAPNLDAEGRLGNGYFWPENLPIYDQYAEKDEPDKVMDDQFAKLQLVRGGKGPDPGQVFCLGWALTPSLGDVLSGPTLLQWARNAMTPRLGLVFEKSSKTRYPNIIGMDGVETTDGVAVSIAINTRAKY